MPKKSRKIFVADLKPGDVIETTCKVQVVTVENLDKSKPTVTKGIVVIKGKPVEGGWRGIEAEFVISNDEQLKLLKRADDDKSWLSVASDWFASLTAGLVVVAAIAAVYVSNYVA